MTLIECLALANAAVTFGMVGFFVLAVGAAWVAGAPDA